MMKTNQTTRSLKTTVNTTILTTATSIVLALGAMNLQAQTAPIQNTQTNQENAIVQTPSVIQSVESFVSAAELLQNEIQFTPASIDITNLKRSVQYPEAALKRNVSGRFELIVYVNSTGAVNSVNFVTERADDSAMNAIIASACDAVKKSTFKPAILNNKAISSAVRIPFNFVL